MIEAVRTSYLEQLLQGLPALPAGALGWLPALRAEALERANALTVPTTRDEDYEIEYSDRGLLEEKAFILAKFLYERDSTERFYGFGNDSDEDRESNYTGEDLYVDATPGYWILPAVNLSYRMRIRRYNVQHGQVANAKVLHH